MHLCPLKCTWLFCSCSALYEHSIAAAYYLFGYGFAYGACSVAKRSDLPAALSFLTLLCPPAGDTTQPDGSSTGNPFIGRWGLTHMSISTAGTACP